MIGPICHCNYNIYMHVYIYYALRFYTVMTVCNGNKLSVNI